MLIRRQALGTCPRGGASFRNCIAKMDLVFNIDIESVKIPPLYR